MERRVLARRKSALRAALFVLILTLGCTCAASWGQARQEQPPAPALAAPASKPAQDSQTSQPSQDTQTAPDKYALDRHTITVTFNYDFNNTPSCQQEPKLKTCIAQFIVYDVSGPKLQLFLIPVPPRSRGLVKGIQGRSPTFIFVPGTHLIAVTAQERAGAESLPAAATVKVVVRSRVADSPADSASPK